MQSINARSLAPDARDWLACSRHPIILHIFDQTCNLINEHREVLSIVTEGVGNGPFNLVVDEPIIFSKNLNIKSQIDLDPSVLRVGQISIHINDAKLWSPRPVWEILHATKDSILNQLTGYQFLIPDSLVPNPLLSALAAANIAACVTASRQLAGLGQGLTPSGDDFILGAVLAAWIIHPPKIAKVIAQEITNAAAPLTTSLSAAWLRSTGKGEAGILWHHFFDALISANSMAAQDSLNKILAVGETSGADALAGFTGVFVHWAERTSPNIL